MHGQTVWLAAHNCPKIELVEGGQEQIDRALVWAKINDM